MTLESSIVPVPSELVMIPAGWAAASGTLDPFLGATLWCAILVSLGYFLGEPVIAIVKEYTYEVTIVVVPLIALYIWWKIWGEKRQKAKKNLENSEKKI